MPTANVFGELFICQFPFTSGAMSKTCPALVLFDVDQDVIICRVTTVRHTGPLDVTLNDWRAAGLLQPSVVRLDRIVTAEKTVLIAVLACSATLICRPFGRFGING